MSQIRNMPDNQFKPIFKRKWTNRIFARWVEHDQIKRKNMKLHFSHFLHFFHFIHFVKICEYGSLIESTNRRCPLKPQNRTYPRSEFLNFGIFRKIFWKITKINSYGEFTWSVYWNACKTLFLKPWILQIFLEVQIIWMNRSHRFRAKKCYFRIAKSRIFGYLVHLKHFIWREK